MIVRIDMHIRDERLLEWLQDKHDQAITAQSIAVEFKCHRHTVRAMMRRLKQAGYIEIIQSKNGSPSGHTIRIIECNQNLH